MASRSTADDTTLTGPQQWGLWLAVFLAAALRFFHLGQQSLWVDEIFTWNAASPFAPLSWADVLSDLHGPFVSALVHGWMRLFGDSEFALRAPMALASIALVPATAFLARRAVGKDAFLPAAFLVAVSPWAVWYGQELRNYAFAMLWAALALSATLEYRARGRSRDLALLVVWTALGAWSNLNALLLFPALVFLLLVDPPKGRGRVLPLVAACAGLAVLLSPWILKYLGVLELHRLVPGREALPAEEPLRGATTFTWPAVPFTFFVFSVGYTLGPGLRELHADPSVRAFLPYAWAVVPAIVLFGALALAGVLRAAKRPFAFAALALSIAVPLGLVVYFALMNFKTYNPRYVSVGWPAWIVFVSAGFAAWSRPARLIAGIGVLGLCVVSLAHHYFDVRHAKEDFRAVAHALHARVAPGDSIVAVANHSPLVYYWRDRVPGDRKPGYRVFWAGYARDERLVPQFAPFVNRTGGATWVVVSRTEDLDPKGRFEPWLTATFRPERTDFTGVRLYRIPPVPGTPDP